MCGICGKLVFDEGATVSPSVVKAMADTMEHRGPDDEGYYVSGRIGLGFRRLSIIDLATGHQPISNEDGTVWIVFNGEIYNYRELREDLLTKGHRFRTHTDTEVIVHLYEEEGEECVQKLRGMFGFAIWDKTNDLLFLARDRVGIKPLYYSLSDNALLFASEMKAILADPEVVPELSSGMIDRFLTFKYLPGNETMLRNVIKLPPGSYLIAKGRRTRLKRYWDLRFESSNISIRSAEDQLASLLEEAVKVHMISDVPVGFLLSGGMDSTAMLSIASSMTARQGTSFTVGFDTPGVVDERPYARLVAKKFGTEHHEITISAREFENFLPDYVWHMEEPVCEPPAIALYYVSRLARNSVKVLISGEGGDEGFGGYPTYRNLLWLERLRRGLGPFRRTASVCSNSLVRLLGLTGLEKYARQLGVPPEFSYYGGLSNALGDSRRNFDDLYTASFRQGLDRNFSINAVREGLKNAPVNDDVNHMLYVDTKTWLVDDLLLKADKMTMANSVELRVPLLDHKVLEFAASLPGNFKIRSFTTKYIAKKALTGLVPTEILHRKKAGFPVPYSQWLRTDLRSWISDILLDRETLARGYFKSSAIEALILEHVRSGGRSKELFSLLVLELWHRQFLDKGGSSSPTVPRASLNSAAMEAHNLA